jgi:hypothetical protein
VLKVVHDVPVPAEAGSGGCSLLDEIVRDGARQMLAAALLAEVAAYIEAHADQLDARSRGQGGAPDWTNDLDPGEDPLLSDTGNQ